MPNNQIGLQAIFENEDFQKGINDYNKSVSDASSQTESAGSSMSAVWDGLAGLGQIAFTALGAGIAAVTGELYLAVDAAMDAEEILTRMEFVVDGVSERTDVTSEEVLALADSLSQVVPIDDEVIAQAIAMGLTFDGVNKDNIQPLISAATDLSEFTGKDLPGSMRELSLAISDPEKAMRLLRDANITLTDEEKKSLKAMGDVGDTAGITSFLLNELKNKGIIGLGEAMGDTATGKMTIMQTAIGNLQEALGGGLLNSLAGVFDRITVFATDPRTIQFFTDLGDQVGAFADTALAKLPDIMTVIEDVGTWFVNNKPIIVGVLAAIGVAMAAFAATAVEAGIASLAALWPVVLVMAAVGAAVALLYTAWTEDWGGIREAVADAWIKVKPVFDRLQVWIKNNLPKAIKVLSDFWTKTLLPAMKTVFAWIADNVIPVLADLVVWLGDNVPKALKEVSDFIDNKVVPALKNLSDMWNDTLLPAIKEVYAFISGTLIPALVSIASTISGVLSSALKAISAVWTTVLLPAITAVYNFINTFIMPIFNAVSNLINAVLNVALRALAGLWQNVLYPALQSVWSFISSNIMPIFSGVAATMNGVLATAVRTLSSLWNNTLAPALNAVWDILKPFATFLSTTLYNAFNSIKTVVQWIVDKINGLATALDNLTLPPWATPGSPTPWEIGLVGINEQLDQLANAQLPAVTAQLNVMASTRGVIGSSTKPIPSNTISNNSTNTNNYLFGSNFNLSGDTGVVEILQGLT